MNNPVQSSETHRSIATLRASLCMVLRNKQTRTYLTLWKPHYLITSILKNLIGFVTIEIKLGLQALNYRYGLLKYQVSVFGSHFTREKQSKNIPQKNIVIWDLNFLIQNIRMMCSYKILLSSFLEIIHVFETFTYGQHVPGDAFHYEVRIKYARVCNSTKTLGGITQSRTL